MILVFVFCRVPFVVLVHELGLHSMFQLGYDNVERRHQHALETELGATIRLGVVGQVGVRPLQPAPLQPRPPQLPPPLSSGHNRFLGFRNPSDQYIQ